MMFAVPTYLQPMPSSGDIAPLMSGAAFDLESIIPIELIRSHTKTEDVPSVSDTLLQLYRRSAIEQAQLYTGLVLSEQRVIAEPLQLPSDLVRKVRHQHKHRLQHPTADGNIYVFGGSSPTQLIKVAPGATEFVLPAGSFDIDLSSCCHPCGDQVSAREQVMYKAGFSSPEAIPSGIILGCLKYIAWNVSNPGDVLMTVKNTDQANSSGLVGTNNAVWASGAIEQWRTYVRTAT